MVMQRYISHITLCLMLLLGACAHYPLNMSETEWNRLTPEQQLEARKQQAAMDKERAIEREKARLAREARQVEEARIQRERDVRDGMVHQFGAVCIGGSRCPDSEKKQHIYSLHRFAFVDKIEFAAHDNIGNKHGATIAVQADDCLIEKSIDIKRAGSVHTIFVGKVARNILVTIQNDDEVMLEYLKVFGTPLDARTAGIFEQRPPCQPEPETAQ